MITLIIWEGTAKQRRIADRHKVDELVAILYNTVAKLLKACAVELDAIRFSHFIFCREQAVLSWRYKVCIS